MKATTRRRLRAPVVAAAAAALLASAAACDDDDAGGDGIITIHVFGGEGFGYEALIEQYLTDNPDVEIDYQITTDRYDDEYRPTLIQQLEAGNAPDIAAFEEQGQGQMMAMNDAWVDLSEYGLLSRESDYTPWKWELGFTNDGRLAGLGTDVGGMAMCYRTDLFDAAGLPTDREDVAEMWSTWEDFATVAQEFVNSGVDAAFIDSVNQIFNVRMIQEAGAADGITYFDRDNNYVLGETPAVRTTFDYVMDLQAMGAIGPYENFTQDWNTAMEAGGFATMGCPAWMTGVIEGTSGEANAGNWDIAPAPGGGGGNWGGSWLGVTVDSDLPAEAAALVDYLTNPEGQLGAWEAVGNFPSAPAAQEDPSVADTTPEYFNNAPVAEIISASVAAYDPVYFGSLHSQVRSLVEDVLFGVVQGEIPANEAWEQFVAEGQRAVDLGG